MFSLMRLIIFLVVVCFILPVPMAFADSQPNPDKLLAQTPDLNPVVLKLGLAAYAKVRAEGGDEQQILTIIDYSKPSYQPRLWVLDLKTDQVSFHELVAHGKGSGLVSASSFSDRDGSEQSSLGVFLTGKPYRGRHGYSLKLNGLEQGVNAHAASRAIVLHAANYATADFARQHGRLGLSWGCPAVDPRITKPLINTIKGGTVIFAYYPNQQWLQNSPFLNS